MLVLSADTTVCQANAVEINHFYAVVFLPKLAFTKTVDANKTQILRDSLIGYYWLMNFVRGSCQFLEPTQILKLLFHNCNTVFSGKDILVSYIFLLDL